LTPLSLIFPDRGVVWVDQFKDFDSLITEIEFIQTLPKAIGDILNYGRWPNLRPFMAVSARKPHTTVDSIAVYDIDPKLCGMDIAEEATQYFKYLQQECKIEKMILRFPNGGTVMVHRYALKQTSPEFLCIAIQRARTMKVPAKIVAIAA
jgi:hypothetical protein